MSTIQELSTAIATTSADYRNDELGPFTASHVVEWVEQFDEADRLLVLSEMDHVLKKTYFSQSDVSDFLQSLAKAPNVVGADPAGFWKSAGVLDIQQGGNSQKEMLEKFDDVLQEQFGMSRADCEASSGNFVYLDDAIFTGNRVWHDLEPWIIGDAPEKATVHVIVSVKHTGSYFAAERLDKAAKAAGKAITFTWWRARSVENRKYYRNQSEVLWPSELPADEADAVFDYAKAIHAAGYPHAMRAQGGTPKDGVFSGEAGRAVLERVFLKAGVRIRSICPNLKESARPLGYSLLKTLGFGATVVTYRNCPNNCPLALWAGDPWYPLFRRKTN